MPEDPAAAAEDSRDEPRSPCSELGASAEKSGELSRPPPGAPGLVRSPCCCCCELVVCPDPCPGPCAAPWAASRIARRRSLLASADSSMASTKLQGSARRQQSWSICTFSGALRPQKGHCSYLGVL